jgi:hypothetical protein
MDGGGIYSLSAQPGNYYRYNVILNQLNEFGALYLDNLSRYINVTGNVVFNNKRTMLLNDNGDNHIFENWWQNRYTNDIWNSPHPGFGENIFTNNHLISNLSDAPTEIVTAAGTPPLITNPPAGQIRLGITAIKWKTLPFATGYLLRIDDQNDNSWNCTDPNNPTDVCTTPITTTSYDYNFQLGHTYGIWVHALNIATNTYGPANNLYVTVVNPTPTLTPTSIPMKTPNATPGDATGNYLVDMVDYLITSSHYSLTTPLGMSDGDFNHNGLVDLFDFSTLIQHFSQ